MKRPFAIFGSAYLMGLLADVFFTYQELLILLSVALVLFALSMSLKILRKRAYIPAAFIVFAVALFSFILRDSYIHDNLKLLEGKTSEITATICEIDSRHSGSTRYTLCNIRSNEGDLPGNYRVTYTDSQALRARVGDSLVGKLQFIAYDDDFGMSSKKYRFSQGEYLSAIVAKNSYPKVIPAEKDVYSIPSLIRESFQEALCKSLDSESASISSAMLLGIYPGDELYSLYREAGVNHLLVVSGLHMAILAGIVGFFLKKLRAGRIPAAIITIFFILLFMAVTGFRSSAVRAGIMFIALTIAPLFGRENDSLNSLGLAVFIICIISPYAAGDIGFLLSASATMGIILLSAPLTNIVTKHLDSSKRLHRTVGYIVGLLAVSVSANIFTAPVLLANYGYLRLMGIPISVVLSVPASLILFCSLFICLFSALPFISGMALPFALIDGLNCTLSTAVCKALPGSSPVYLGDSSYLLIMAFFIITAIALWNGSSRKVKICTATVMILLLCTSVVANSLYTQNITRLICANNGSGLFAAVCKNGRATIIVAQGKDCDKSAELLRESGVQSIDNFFIGKGSYNEFSSAEYLGEKFGSSPLVLNEDLLPVTDSLKVKDKYSIKYSCDVFGDNSVILTSTSSGGQLSLDLMGKTVIIDSGAAISQPKNADIYICSKVNNDISSAFTIFESDDIINSSTEYHSGNYIVQGYGDALFLDFMDNGEMKIRRCFG